MTGDEVIKYQLDGRQVLLDGGRGKKGAVFLLGLAEQFNIAGHMDGADGVQIQAARIRPI